MKVYFNIPDINEGTTVAIGTFDGVHLGHLAVLEKAQAIAKKNNQIFLVFTFLDHPAIVTGSKAVPLLLTTPDEKIAKLGKLAIDYCIIPKFTRELSVLSPEDFVKKILIEKLGVKNVCVGFNFFFGHKASGNRDTLIELSRKYGFNAEIVEPEILGEEPVSSSLIREHLNKGEIEKANILLGYPYYLKGTVIRGKGIGKKVLGIPTANITIDKRKLLPCNGVYACSITVNGKEYNAVTNIGNRPSFDNGEKSLEVHIVGFDNDIYDHGVELYFKYYLRPEQKFSDIEELKNQILSDKEKAVHLLSEDYIIRS